MDVVRHHDERVEPDGRVPQRQPVPACRDRPAELVQPGGSVVDRAEHARVVAHADGDEVRARARVVEVPEARVFARAHATIIAREM